MCNKSDGQWCLSSWGSEILIWWLCVSPVPTQLSCKSLWIEM